MFKNMKKLLWVSLVSGFMIMWALLQVQAEESMTTEATSTNYSVDAEPAINTTSSDVKLQENWVESIKPIMSDDYLVESKIREKEMMQKYEALKAEKEALKAKMEEDMRAKKEMMQEQLRENQMKMKENIQNFQGEKKALQLWKKLSEEQHNQIEEIKKMWKNEVDTLVATLKGLDDAEKRKAIVDQVVELNRAYAEKIKAIIGDVSEAAVEMVDKRMEVMGTNHEMRKENIDLRYEFRAEKSDMMKKYKATFKLKLKSRLDSISAEKLEKILAKVNTMEETITNNTNISDVSREKMLSQVSALKEILEEKIEEYNLKNDEMIDLDALFE